MMRSLTFALALAPFVARAAILDPAVSTGATADLRNLDELRASESQQEQRLKAIQERTRTLTQVIKQKSKAFSAVSNNAGTASYIWQDEGDTYHRRKRLERMLQSAIREDLREVEQLEAQETDLRAELEWVRVRIREALEAPTPVKEGNFRCQQLPVSPAEGKALSLLQDFGMRKDADTGIEWRSLGWWIGDTGREVHACATGIVIFTGKVQGRGRVIVLDHGDGGITLYANLNDDPELVFRKGEAVRAGRVLGTSRDRIYFEARRNGAAVNPREILPSASLSSVGL